jgi:ATP-binding cassette subfamily C (CFTR/MRP) protein 1
MLRRGRILVLDEPTSNVDKDTEETIQDLIREQFADHTVLTVTHRLNTIVNADKVAVLEGGRLVEFGAPRELFDSDSRFTQLCHHQGLVSI